MLIPKVEGRIEQYIHFLEQHAYTSIGALEFERFETDKTYRSPTAAAVWEKIGTPTPREPAPWGKPWHCAWFRAAYTAPKGGKPLFLSVLPNSDSLAFIDGKPAGALNLFHKKIRIDADGKQHILHVEAYAGHPHGGCGPFEGESIVVTIGKTLPQFPNKFEGGSLLERNEAVFSLFYDAFALFDAAKKLDANSLRKARILKGLYEALITVSFSADGDVLEQQAAAAAKQLAPLLTAKNSAATPTVHLVGHAHIDHAWLWHIGESERKVARTFMNMTRFAKEYPEFIFFSITALSA